MVFKNIKEAAEYLGVTEFKLRGYLYSGLFEEYLDFPRSSTGRIIYTKQTLDNFITRCREYDVGLHEIQHGLTMFNAKEGSVEYGISLTRINAHGVLKKSRAFFGKRNIFGRGFRTHYWSTDYWESEVVYFLKNNRHN